MLVAELASADRNAPRKGDRQPRIQRTMEGPWDDEHLQVIEVQPRVEAMWQERSWRMADPGPLPFVILVSSVASASLPGSTGFSSLLLNGMTPGLGTRGSNPGGTSGRCCSALGTLS